MITDAPYIPVDGGLVSVSDPGARLGYSSAAIQIQNASPFAVNVAADGQVFAIQSFTAQTVPVAGDATPVTITPTGVAAASAGTITTVWLLANENPPMDDGSLTAAAIVSALTTSPDDMVASNDALVDTFTVVIPAPGPGVRIILGTLQVAMLSFPFAAGVGYGALLGIVGGNDVILPGSVLSASAGGSTSPYTTEMSTSPIEFPRGLALDFNTEVLWAATGIFGGGVGGGQFYAGATYRLSSV